MKAEWNSKIGELEGVSSETLERIDRVSRRSEDGRVPRFPQYVMLTRAGPAGARRIGPGQTTVSGRRKEGKLTPPWWERGSREDRREFMPQPPLSLQPPVRNELGGCKTSRLSGSTSERVRIRTGWPRHLDRWRASDTYDELTGKAETG
jgi:hypothetical protein